MASLNVLEAEKTLYEANAKKAAADLKAAIEARATDVLQDALVNEKIVKLKELLIQETASMKTSGTAYLAIKQSHCHAFHRFPSLSYLFSRSKSEAMP